MKLNPGNYTYYQKPQNIEAFDFIALRVLTLLLCL